MIDSHCHLYFDSLKKNLTHIINNSKKNNLNAILSINTDPLDFDKHLNLIKNYKSIFISYGLHPEHVNNKTLFTTDQINKNCLNSKVIGIGETGLDFYHSLQFKKKQYEIFETHIEASIINKLPLIIHQRNSESEIINVLKKYQQKNNLSVVFHCFTGSKKLLNFCIDNNFYISLSGIITFKNANDLREIIRYIPKNLILLETDSPFLAPVPMRGKINEPAFVKFVAEYLALFFNITFEDIVNITDNNFYNLFSKAKRYSELS